MKLVAKFVFKVRLWLSVAIVATGLLSLSTAAKADDFGKPSNADRQATRWVCELMEKQHLSQHPIDDEISQRALVKYLKALDPAKVYFLKSDVDEFGKFKDSLDDQIKAGDFTAAFEIFSRFLLRVDGGVKTATYWCDQAHDFSVDEELVTDRDLVDYAQDEAELNQRWRQRVKYNILVLKGDETLKEDPLEKLRRRFKAFGKRMHQVDNEDVVEMFVSAVTTSFDPHTSYMSKDSFKSFDIAMTLQLEGIGATLQGDDEGYTVIKRIVSKGAADRQGQLKVEDKIIAVGQGDDGESVDVNGMKLDDVVNMIRGKAGTTVRLSVMTGNEIKTVKIVREKVQLEDEAAHGKVFEDGTKADGTPYKIGVIDLPSFYADMENSGSTGGRSTTVDVDRILQDFKSQGVDAVVLDLRHNGGGSLREAIDCTGLFVDSGPVVQVKDQYGQIQQHNDERRGMSWDKPLVVLTSKFSASASEILAGAVKDYGRGIIVGDTTTHGKGTVQSLLDINRLVFRTQNPPQMFGALKITMQQFYRPNGDSTQKRGVISDVVLPSITDKMDVGETDLDFPVEFDRIAKAAFSELGMAKAEIIQKLSDQSQARIASSEDFAKDLRRISKYMEFKKQTAVELNETKFRAKRAEFDAEKEDEKTIEDQVNRNDNGIKRDHYLDEVLRITTDYAKALSDG